MEQFYAIILGVVQGLTEFLPVSSSGHLVLMQNLLGLKESELLFDISVHVGTLIAICIVFFKEIYSIIMTLINFPALIKSSSGIKTLFKTNKDVRIAIFIIVGCIPTGILGILFHKMADQIFGAVWIVGLMLIITGTFLWFTRKLKPQNGQLNFKNALIIGFVQGISILPGISRSGSTISTALFLGVNQELAGRYSFLLSIPAILGALVLELSSSMIQSPAFSWQSILIGACSALIVGCVALKILLYIIKKGNLYFFATYCWVLGGIALWWDLMFL
ncbi:Undecaprenyl-diphosphatase [Candidatus Magnetomoraceae bacterium gMMP-15]